MSEKPCLACGNNQTSHIQSWLSQTSSVFTAPIHTWLAKSFLASLAAYITSPLLKSFIWLYSTVGVLKINTDPTKTVNQRGKVLWQEAVARGIPMHNFYAFGKLVDLYGATVKGKKIYFNGLPRPLRTPNNSEWWLDDKYLLKTLLQKANVPVARGGAFSSYEPLLKKFRELEKPVIIKPRLGSRGRHTTTHITSEQELKKAFESAKQLCHWVILEEHLVGSVYRGTIINGTLAGVLRGDPPRVIGDGIHTISELVVLKNQNKHAEVKDVVLSQEHVNFLSRLGLTTTNILPAGKTIDLIEKIGVNYGGCAAEVTSSTHPETIQILEKAAAVVGDPVIGFDFIIPDISKNPHEQKWGIIECNGLPFINLHYDPIEGEDNNVAKPLWDYVEENIDQF
jgi:cyanophycin synthetase